MVVYFSEFSLWPRRIPIGFLMELPTCPMEFPTDSRWIVVSGQEKWKKNYWQYPVMLYHWYTKIYYPNTISKIPKNIFLILSTNYVNRLYNYTKYYFKVCDSIELPLGDVILKKKNTECLLRSNLFLHLSYNPTI